MLRIRSKRKEDLKTPPIGKDKTKKIVSHPHWIAGVIIIIISAILSILIYPNILTHPTIYHVGDIADKNIKASCDLLVENRKLTEKSKEEAVRAVRDVYDFDPSASHTIRRIREAFRIARKKINNDLEKKEINELKKEFFEILYLNIDDEIFDVFARALFSPEVENRVIGILDPIIKKGVMADKKALEKRIERNIIIHDIISGNEIKINDLDRFYDIKEARKAIVKKVGSLKRLLNPELANAIKKFSISLIHPNITFNSRETELRKEIARRSVKPFYFQIKKGEMLVREGEKITPDKLLKLKAQYKALRKKKGLTKVLAMFILLCSMMGTIYFVDPTNRSHHKIKDLIFAGLLLLFILAILIFASFTSEELSRGFQRFSPNALFFGIPVASGAMIASLFLGIGYAIGFSFIASTISSIILGGHIEYFIYFFIGSLFAAYGVRDCRERIVFIKTGAKVGILNIILAISVETVFGLTGSTEIIVTAVSAFTGGIFTGIITIGFQPLIESTFRYTTDIKLLELANLDQPILQELMMRAPGTYHHSMIVSNMVEAAAHEIGANPLLAKVAAYYHDIGKMKKPLYFIENQMGTENRHEKLAPSMSALILISHVKEGIELAKEYKLGQEIMDIIQQHHGTSLISYFYEKAKEQAERSEKARPVNEADFRYPGPKPQTKEAGLVMLADSVEAACRSLSEPTPARIKGMVQNIINKIFADGQLDECELTLKDLNNIAKSFNKTLSGIFHHRIEYPETTATGSQQKKITEKRATDGSADQIRKEDTRDKEKDVKAENKNGLKRLGL